MLKFLSKQQRARNAFLIFFCFIMVVTLVIFLGMPVGHWISGAVKTDTEMEPTTPVAEVDGDEITVGELQKVLSRMAQGQGGQNVAFMRSFSDEMLDQLIQQRIVKAEAKRLGITVADDELRREIARQVPQFLDANGRFISYDVYQRAIEGSGSTIEEFEDGIRQSLLNQKLRAYITAGVTVSPRQVEEDYTRQNTSVNVVYLIVDPKKFEDQVEVSDSEARTYFDQHKDEFKIVELERKVEYIFIPFEALQKKVQVSDEELNQEYKNTQSQQTVGATVSQIVFPFNDTNEAEVRQKADEVVKKARGDEKTPAEDFAKLGGKSIGFVKKDDKDTSYKQRVFLLREPQKDVTEPIRENNAFYVLKVTQRKQKSLAEAKPELLKQIKERQARTQATQLAMEIKKRLSQTKDIRKVAEEFRERLGNSLPDQIVRHTGFFATSDQLPEFEVYSSSFTSAAANLTDVGQVGNEITLKDGVAIPQLAAKREPHAPQFDEVKDRVIARIRKQKAADWARRRAAEMAKQAPTVEALQKLAKTENLEAQEQEDFKRGSILKDLERSDQLEGFAFSVQPGQVAQHAIKVGDKFVILGVTERKSADLTKLAKEQESNRERLLDQRRSEFFQAYLEKIKDQMAAEGRIIVYQDVFNTITAGAGGDIRDLLNITPGKP
ncbi:MAG: SurA N-terminal domain-containing protein [Acidobacteria bacterium]|nr:SurA N-terminal domain-containing protein [Acidobacteriota bacterium]